ncbi:MAG TPA: 2-phospho-L-lactate transferase [Burkholderiales bacterium]|nr:2-phospho-L-lactate transferase [Burkholderiales bacterium]
MTKPGSAEARSKKVLALSGGVGGAKLADGLARTLAPEQVAIVCNTGDDFEHLGLTICPDIDSVLYKLAGRNDTLRGWGLANESWTVMGALKQLGGEAWFNLGDLDLATHLHRTHLLRQGRTLSEVTAELARAHGVQCTVWPMSDDPVRTLVRTSGGELSFQHYFVREQCRPEVSGFRFDGIDRARPQPAMMELLGGEVQAIVICPSNPFVSVDPILKLPGVRAALKASGAPIVAVSPIIGGQAVKGPAAKMMAELRVPVNARGVAAYYGNLLDGMVIDQQDASLANAVAATGVQVEVAQTVMNSIQDSCMLADTVLNFARKIAG